MTVFNSLPDTGDRTHIVQTIQEAILEGICLLDILPGHQLKEADLAKQFGVSRTPVRDALNRIAHLDLVETRNGVGTIVKQLSNEQIVDVYQTRLRLATMIGELSTSEVNQSHKDAIQKLLTQAKELQSGGQARKYVQINHELHQIICQLISNSVLRSFWRQTYYQAASIWYRIADITGEETLSSLVNELTELSIALNNNDLTAVGHIQRIYIGYGYNRIQEHLFPA